MGAEGKNRSLQRKERNEGKKPETPLRWGETKTDELA